MTAPSQRGTMFRPTGRDRDRLSVNPTTFLSHENTLPNYDNVDVGMCSWLRPGETASLGTVDFKTGLCYCCGAGVGGDCDTGCICCLACMTCTIPCAYGMLESTTVDAIASSKTGRAPEKDCLGICLVFSFAEVFSMTSLLPILNCIALGAYENKIRRAGNRRKPTGACSGNCRTCAYCFCAPCVIAQLDREASLIVNTRGQVEQGQPLLRNTMV